MNEVSVGGGQSKVHQGDDVDFRQFILPLSLSRLALDDVAGVEDGSVYIVLLSDLLHLYNDQGTVVQSAKYIENGDSVVFVIGELGGVDVFDGLDREFGYNGLNETDEDVGMIGIAENFFESKVGHQRNVFGHGCSCIVG